MVKDTWNLLPVCKYDVRERQQVLGCVRVIGCVDAVLAVWSPVQADDVLVLGGRLDV